MDNFHTSYITKEKTPLVIEPKNKNISLRESFAQLTKNQDLIKDKLLKSGAILFRNFPFETVDHFADALEALNTGRCVDYIGGDSPRIKIKGNIYTSTEAPPSLKIPLHNELSFVKHFPSHIFFFCERPSETGGETILGDSRKIYKEINATIRERFAEKQLQYVSRYYYKSKLMNLVKSHKTWINVFETDKKDEVEQKCVANEFSYAWKKNDWLEIRQIRPAISVHPITQEKVWFNQAHLYDFNPKLLGWKNYLGSKLFYCRKHTKLHDAYFGDNSRITRHDLYHVLDVLDANTIAFKWHKGDLLMVDNMLMMHGRQSFTGKRRVLTAMTR